MKITYLGHSCFKIESQSYSIVLDPYTEGSVPGYKPVQETADRILCSHRHQDHCGAKGAALWEDVKASPFTVETIQRGPSGARTPSTFWTTASAGQPIWAIWAVTSPPIRRTSCGTLPPC